MRVRKRIFAQAGYGLMVEMSYICKRKSIFTMPSEATLINKIYQSLIALSKDGEIPVRLRRASVVGTVQDDPFDHWVEKVLKKALPHGVDIFHSGNLTTPDLIVREKTSGVIIGLEIKKLIQCRNGKDPRGMTIDYNSTLPCGKAFVKVGDETRIVPCFYLFALLNAESTRIISLILLDGDFLNYDIELYKEAKYANVSEYCHGPYGEGSVRHRRMYTYPNPLNSKLSAFYKRMVLVVKKHDYMAISNAPIKEQIVRTDKYGNSFYYVLVDELNGRQALADSPVTLTGIFDACKVRESKERVAYIPVIP